jgi:hypothetical protein
MPAMVAAPLGSEIAWGETLVLAAAAPPPASAGDVAIVGPGAEFSLPDDMTSDPKRVAVRAAPAPAALCAASADVGNRTASVVEEPSVV